MRRGPGGSGQGWPEAGSEGREIAGFGEGHLGGVKQMRQISGGDRTPGAGVLLGRAVRGGIDGWMSQLF